MNLFCLNKFYDNEEIVVVVLGIFNGRNALVFVLVIVVVVIVVVGH